MAARKFRLGDWVTKRGGTIGRRIIAVTTHEKLYDDPAIIVTQVFHTRTVAGQSLSLKEDDMELQSKSRVKL